MIELKLTQVEEIFKHISFEVETSVIILRPLFFRRYYPRKEVRIDLR